MLKRSRQERGARSRNSRKLLPRERSFQTINFAGSDKIGSPCRLFPLFMNFSCVDKLKIGERSLSHTGACTTCRCSALTRAPDASLNILCAAKSKPCEKFAIESALSTHDCRTIKLKLEEKYYKTQFPSSALFSCAYFRRNMCGEYRRRRTSARGKRSQNKCFLIMLNVSVFTEQFSLARRLLLCGL